MNAIINGWNNFVEKHPAASKWIREGGLFMIVSNVITVFKYLILQFLPKNADQPAGPRFWLARYQYDAVR